MLHRFWAQTAVALLAATSAGAQTAKPDAANPEAAAAAAAASAAMERARRQANGPMRVILEASRPRRKGAESEAASVPDTTSVRPVTSRTAAPPAPPVAAPAPAPVQATAEARPPSAAPPPAAAKSPALDSSVAAEITLSSPLLQSTAAAPVPALQTDAAAAVLPLASGPMALPAIAAGPVRPRLISPLNLEVPQRVLDDMGRNTVVLIDITIRPDGSVAAVALAGPAPRQLLRAVQPTIEQWRFEPLPSVHVHRIELHFNPDN